MIGPADDSKLRALWSGQDPAFDKYTALRIRASLARDGESRQPEDIYDFFVNTNMDNIYMTGASDTFTTEAEAKDGFIFSRFVSHESLLCNHTASTRSEIFSNDLAF